MRAADDAEQPPLVVIRGLRTAEQWALVEHYQQAQQERFEDGPSSSLVVAIRDDLRLPLDHDDGDTTPQPDLPPGFQSFREFGATGPDTLHAHNLSVQQHRLVAWLLALHLVAALELAVTAVETTTGVSEVVLPRSTATLPPPLYLKSEEEDASTRKKEAWETLLLHPGSVAVHCTTSYVHSVIRTGGEGSSSMTLIQKSGGDDTAKQQYSDNALRHMIVDGLAVPDYETALEALLLPKTEQTAHRGWVLDLDADSKRSKLLTRVTGDFLGFRDWKMAYYGVPQSGPLQVFLPVSEEEQDGTARALTLLMVCEDDAPAKSPTGCLLHRDAAFLVQGLPTQTTPVDSDLVATVSGKQTCVQVHLPPRLELSQRQSNATVADGGEETSTVQQFGIYLNITVTNPQTTWKNGPCSVAHIVWTTAT